MSKWMTTAEAAEVLMIKPASMRSILYNFGDVYGLVPNKDSGGHLRWDRMAVTKTAIRRFGDAQIAMSALSGVLDWLNEQRIRTEDPRIGDAYAVIQMLEERYK